MHRATLLEVGTAHCKQPKRYQVHKTALLALAAKYELEDASRFLGCQLQHRTTLPLAVTHPLAHRNNHSVPLLVVPLVGALILPVQMSA